MKTQNEIQRIATEVAAQLAATATKAASSLSSTSSPDHDLLQRLDQKVDGIIVQIAGISDGVNTQIKDHETRLNALETSKTTQSVMLSIGIGLLSILVGIIVYHIQS